MADMKLYPNIFFILFLDLGNYYQSQTNREAGEEVSVLYVGGKSQRFIPRETHSVK